MKTQYQSGSAHLVVIIVLVLGLLGTLGFVFWQNFLNKQADNVTQQTEKVTTVSSQEKLDTIRTALEKLGHRTDNTIASKGMEIDFQELSTIVSIYDYDVDVIFNGSIYATNLNIAPVGTTGPNGSGVEEAIDLEAVKAILEENGLVLDGSKKPLSTQTLDFYTSDLVQCNVFDTTGISSVRCTGKDSVKAALKEAKDAYNALVAKYQDVTLKSYAKMYLYKSESKKVLGLYVSGLEGADTDSDAYLVKPSDKAWEYAGTSVAGGQGLDYPSCEDIAKPGYENVFAVKDCE